MLSLRPIHWLTTLSLDAPLVAVVWQELIAETTGLTIHWIHRVLIFTCVWLGYSADRWLDAFRYRETESRRHQFHKKHRDLYFGIWIFVLAGAILMAVFYLERSELIKGVCLALTSILITYVIQKKTFGTHQNGFKSLFTAFLITGSTALFSINIFEPNNFGYSLILLALFGLFLYNCLLIHHWDKELDIAHDEGLSLSKQSLQQRLIIILIVSELLAFVAWVALGSNIFAATTLSFIGLATLQRTTDNMAPDVRRTLADIVLLSPIVILLW